MIVILSFSGGEEEICEIQFSSLQKLQKARFVFPLGEKGGNCSVNFLYLQWNGFDSANTRITKNQHFFQWWETKERKCNLTTCIL